MTASEVQGIRVMHHRGEKPSVIARYFHTTRIVVYGVVNKKTYRDVP